MIFLTKNFLLSVDCNAIEEVLQKNFVSKRFLQAHKQYFQFFILILNLQKENQVPTRLPNQRILIGKTNLSWHPSNSKADSRKKLAQAQPQDKDKASSSLIPQEKDSPPRKP